MVPTGTNQPRPSFHLAMAKNHAEAIAANDPQKLKTYHVIWRILARAYNPDPDVINDLSDDPRYLADVESFCVANKWINTVEMTAYDDMMAILVANGWYPHIIELPQSKFSKEIHAWCNDQFGPQFWQDKDIHVVTDGEEVVPRLTQEMLDRAMWMVVNKDGHSLTPLFAFRKAEHAVAFKVRWV